MTRITTVGIHDAMLLPEAGFYIMSDGDMYLIGPIFSSGNYTDGCLAQKSTDGGTNWSAGVSYGMTSMFGGPSGFQDQFTFDSDIDSTGIVHCVAQSDMFPSSTTRDVIYFTYNTNTDAWSGATGLTVHSTEYNHQVYCSIAVDENDKAHLVFGDVLGDYYYRTNKSGSWSDPLLISTMASGGFHYSKILAENNNKIHIWLTVTDMAWFPRHYIIENGVISSTSSWVNISDGSPAYGIQLVGSGSNIYVYNITSPAALAADDIIQFSGCYNEGIAYRNGIVYTIFYDSNNEGKPTRAVKAIGGGWTDKLVIDATVTYMQAPCTQFSYRNMYDNGKFNFLYPGTTFPTKYYWYESLSVASSSKHAYLNGVESDRVKHAYVAGKGARGMWYIPVATGDYFMRGGADVLRAANGKIYIFCSNNVSSFYIHMFTSTNNGLSWTTTTISSGTIYLGSYIHFISAALDSAGYIHILVGTGTAQLLGYNTLNTANDSFGTWETLTGRALSQNAGHTISIDTDSNNKPHVLYSATAGGYFNVYYINKTGSNWSSPELIKTSTSNSSAYVVDILVRDSNIVEAFWGDQLGNYGVAVGHRTRDSGGSWGTTTDWTNCVGGHIGIRSIVYDNGTVYRFADQYSSNGTVYCNDVATTITGVESDFVQHSTESFAYDTFVWLGTSTTFNLGYAKQKRGGAWGSKTTILNSNTTETNTLAYSYWNNYNPVGIVPFTWTQSASGVETIYYGEIGVDVESNSSAHAMVHANLVATPTSKYAYLISNGEILLPDSDITTGSWVDEDGHTILYPSVADNSDSTFVWYDDVPINSYFEVGLSNPVGTIVTGNHYVEFRAYKKVGSSPVTVKCELRQGSSTVIAYSEQVITYGVTTYHFSLTPSEISNISNYNDLRIRITVTAK